MGGVADAERDARQAGLVGGLQLGFINFFLHELGAALVAMLNLLPVQHFTVWTTSSAAAVGYYAGFINYFVPVGDVLALIGLALSALILYVIGMFVVHTVRDVIP